MKIKNFLILGILLIVFLLPFSFADIISINSGGSRGIVINPSEFIEGFFFSQNKIPIVSNVLLFSSASGNTTNENLTVTYSSMDPDLNPITNITDWRIDGNSINVLNMPFDTRIVSNDSGVVRDYSTYAINGTLGGGNINYMPTYVENCQIGGCYSFDVLKMNYVRTNNNLLLDSNQTFSAWSNFGIDSGLSGILTLHDHVNTANIGINRNDVKFCVSIGYIDGTREYNSKCTNYNSVIGEWNHVVVVYDLSNNKIIFYVNGNFDKEYILTKTVKFISQRALVGQWSNTYLGSISYGFNGSIDNVQIFNRALTEAQIKEIYNAGLAGKSVEKFVSSETKVGEIWRVAVTANDKFSDSVTVLSNELEIINNIPNTPEPILVSADLKNESDSNLNCSFSVLDSDSSLLNITINWLKDGISILNNSYSNIINGTNYLDVLSQTHLTLGDVWKCSVIFYDGYDYSGWGDSNELEIIDITKPIINIISPEPTNYSTVHVDFNISVIENEEISMCFYNLDDLGNVSMNEINNSYFSIKPILGPGPHDVWFYCNDTSNNWGSNFTNFSIDNAAAMAILLSDDLADAIRWNVFTLPADDLDAIGNNLNGTTNYYLNISAINTLVDIYVKADGDLFSIGGDSIGLGNETFSVNYTNSTVPGGPTYIMDTNYTLIASAMGDNSIIYLKFYLDAPVAQPAGQYLNQLNFKAVREGQDIYS